MQYPLNPLYEKKVHGKSNEVGLPDSYHQTSLMTLSEHINCNKVFLAENYWFGNLIDEKLKASMTEEKQYEHFINLTQVILEKLKQGFSASSCEDCIIDSLSNVFEDEDLRGYFARATVYAVCVELLSLSGFEKNAWSSLTEYKKYETWIEITLEKEMDLLTTRKHQSYGKQSYKYRQHLKSKFLTLLENKAPANGWKSQQDAAKKLAPLVLSFHMESKHSSRQHPTESDVETWLKSWLSKDDECNAFFKNLKKAKTMKHPLISKVP